VLLQYLTKYTIFYAHRSICVSRHPLLTTTKLGWVEQSFTGCIPLLTVTSTFRIGKRQCYLHCCNIMYHIAWHQKLVINITVAVNRGQHSHTHPFNGPFSGTTRGKPVPETHTHTHPFNGPFSGTTRVSRYQKGKTNLDFTEARDGEWQWHQLVHMQVCTSLQTDNHASAPPLTFLQAGCPSCRPTNSVKALKGSALSGQI